MILNNISIVKKTKIIVALDYKSIKSAMKLIKYLDPNIFILKIGQEMFIRFGKKFIIKLNNLGFKIFLDLKFHDIPNTILKAIHSIYDLNICMMSIHISGGTSMLKVAKNALYNFIFCKPLLFGVTVLTSLSQFDLYDLGISITLSDYILKLSKLAKNSGLDGVICPGRESKRIKSILGNKFKTIVPGIRFKNYVLDDQKMVTNLKNIIEYNIDYIVVGRSVTKSYDPIESLYKILNFINKN